MKNFQRLIRIRLLQDQIMQRDLVDANSMLSKTTNYIDALQQQRVLSTRARTAGLELSDIEALAEADAFLTSMPTHAAKLAVKAKSQCLLLQISQDGYHLAHAELRKAETLLKAERKVESARRDKEIQKQADDSYLSTRIYKTIANCLTLK